MSGWLMSSLNKSASWVLLFLLCSQVPMPADDRRPFLPPIPLELPCHFSQNSNLVLWGYVSPFTQSFYPFRADTLYFVSWDRVLHCIPIKYWRNRFGEMIQFATRNLEHAISKKRTKYQIHLPWALYLVVCSVIFLPGSTNEGFKSQNHAAFLF